MVNRCPKCGAKDVEDASPTITREPNGRLFCSMCAHDWPGELAGMGTSAPAIPAGADPATTPQSRPAGAAA